MTIERATVDLGIRRTADGFELCWSNEGIQIPKARAEAVARFILGLSPDNQPLTAMAAAALAVGRSA